MSSIQGKSTSDTLVGTAGNDVIDGGAGFDTVFVPSIGGDLHFELNAQNQFVVVSSQGRDTLKNVEEVESLQQQVLINARPAKTKPLPPPQPSMTETTKGETLKLSDGGTIQVTYVNFWNEEFSIKLEHFDAKGKSLHSFELPTNSGDTFVPLHSLVALENGGYQVEWLEFSTNHTFSYNAQDHIIPNDTAKLAVSGSTPESTKLANNFSVSTWVDHSDAAGYEIWAQVHKPDGSPLGEPTRVNTDKLDTAVRVSVDTHKTKTFVVSWTAADAQGAPDNTEFGRRTFDNPTDSSADTELQDFFARPPRPKPVADGQTLELSDGSHLQVNYSNYWGEDFTITLHHYGIRGQDSKSFDLPVDNAQDIKLSRWVALKDGGYQVQWNDWSGSHTLNYNSKDEPIADANSASTSGGAQFDDDFMPLLSGQHSNDVLKFSGKQSIALFGDDGDDVLQGGSGNDLLDGGTGHDTVLMDASIPLIHYQLNKQGQLLISSPETGVDELRSIEAVKTALGTTQITLATDSEADDIAEQGPSIGNINRLPPKVSAKLQGDSQQSNVLRMEDTSSSVALVGGSRADVISGGSGSDILTGGGGADRFEFAASGNGVDFITDWSAGDTIAVAGAAFNGHSLSQGDGSQVLANQVQWQVHDGITTLYIGTNNTAGADVVIELAGAAKPEQWVLAGDAIHWLESFEGQQPATEIQWVHLAGTRNEYTLMHEWEGAASGRGVEGVWSIRDNVTGALISLVGAERIAFADQAVALDINEGGSVQPAMGLLAATMGADKLANGSLMGEFLAQVDALGERGAAQLIVDSGLLQREAGSTDIAPVLAVLYKNVTGHAPAASELAELLQVHAQQHMSLADWVLLAAHEPQLSSQVEPHVNVIDLLQNGWNFTAWNGDIVGTSGADILHAVQGQSAVVDGGDGVDTLVLGDTAASYQLHAGQDGQWSATSLLRGDTLSLRSIERLQFDDQQAAALDLNGHAGQAASLVHLLYGDEALQNKALVGEVISYVDFYKGADGLIDAAQANGTLDRITKGHTLEDYLVSVDTRDFDKQMKAILSQLQLAREEERKALESLHTKLKVIQEQQLETVRSIMRSLEEDPGDMVKTLVKAPEFQPDVEISGAWAKTGLEYTPWHG